MPSPPSMFNAPSPDREARLNDGYIQPTLNHGLRIWWAYYWPTSLIVGVLDFCIGYGVRVLYEGAAIDARAAKIVLYISPYALTAAIGLLIFRYLLGKRFRHFRLALLPAGYSLGGSPLRPIWRRTIRVWWAFTWRYVIYHIFLAFLLSIPFGAFLGMLIGESNRLLAIFLPIIEQLVIAGGVGLYVMYSNVLDEDFSDFRVVLLPREEPAPQTPVAESLPPQTLPTS